MYCKHRDFVLSLEQQIKTGQVTDLILRVKNEIEEIKKEASAANANEESNDCCGSSEAVPFLYRETTCSQTG